MSNFQPPDTSPYERVAYLVGTPIAHSSSPALHRDIYTSQGQNFAQLLYETTDLSGFISHLKEDPKCMGSGVTMPHKVAVIPFLDELTPEGRAIGAINTIFFQRDSAGRKRLVGTNTDVLGIRDAFLNNVTGSPYWRKPALVMGGGGTCRAAVYALQNFLGCEPIYIVNRDAAEVDAVLKECHAKGAADNLIHVSSVVQAKGLVPPAAVVSAIPDFTPVSYGEKTARQIFSVLLEGRKERGTLLEMCYHPSSDTQISKLAIEAGWQVIGGIEAMIEQGLAQASLWAGTVMDDKLRAVARAAVTKGDRAKL